ncbi:inx-18 [Pristionchus pacificus]|uniref:Innexin n=1 Tax=Pristionchus pacificus TaxID=54126 RepID=A0A2A6BYY3_PRIPA|nr:inx-18 [Pristionchus pacificus]|eukprot:PDM71056.1 inx-18 [Pristionchus pacificus]
MVGGYRIGLHFLASALRFLEPRVDDDFVDRLHYLYTSTMLLMFALLVSAKQYAGHPIECFVPAQFTRAMEQYTENYCWVQNTYWVPFQDLIPHRIDDRERRQIGYYQWAPFALIAAALMFHLPSSLWRQLAPQSGLNVSVVLQMACEQSNLDPLERGRTVDVLARHIDDALSYQRDRGTSGHDEYLFSALKLGKIHGSYVQTGREWRDSGKFPRVTLCDFEIRVLGNIHRHTVQCVLVINMFTEKIFVCLWLWLSFLSLISALNLLFRIAELLSPPARMAFVRQQISLDSDQLPRFVSRFLRPDGVFLIRLLADHAGSILAARVTQQLWTIFLRRTGRPQASDKREPSWGEPQGDSDWRANSVHSWHEPSLPPTIPPSRSQML